MKEIVSAKTPNIDARPDDPRTTEICVSPSWSDFGNSKRKKEKKRLEKERKELEKRLKKEDKEKQAAAKAAGKRLNKRPPPAAMETQRMPAALRSSTCPPAGSTATSQDNSRASSRRSSFNSQDPNSDPASRPTSSRHSFRSLVGFSTSQLPKMFQGRRSRSGSTSTQNSFADGEERYLKDLVGFSEQLDAEVVETEPQPLTPKTRKVSFSLEKEKITVPSHSPEMPTIDDDSPLNSKIDLPWMTSRSRRGSNSSSTSSVVLWATPGTPDGEFRYPSFTRLPLVDDTQEKRDAIAIPSSPKKASGNMSGQEKQNPPLEKRESVDNVQSPQSSQPSNGTGYVQKHRMHQHQRSIVGYQDDLALGGANELSPAQKLSELLELERQRMPPTPKESFESLHQTKVDEKNHDSSEEDTHREKVDEYHSFLSEQLPRSAVVDRQSPASPKVGRISKIPSRPKLAGPSRSANSNNTITTLSNAASSPFRPVSPPSPVSPETVALVSKVSKAERLLGEPVGKAPTPPPKSVSRSNRRITASWALEAVQHSTESLPPSKKVKADLSLKSRKTSSQTSSAGSTTADIIPESPKFAKIPELPHRTEIPLSPPSTRPLDTKSNGSNPRRSILPSTADKDNVVDPEVRFTKPVPEVIVEGIDGDGMTRRTSIKRPRSNPQIQETTVSQALSFLPQLKHQALVKPDRKSPPSSLASSRSSFGGAPPSDKSSSHSPPHFPTPSPPSTRPSSDDGISLPVGASSLNYTPKAGFHVPGQPGTGSLLRPGSGPRRSTMGATSAAVGGPGSAAAAATPIKPLAKMFVICCKCKFWHDLPSQLYKEMAMPRQILEEDHVAESVGARSGDSSKRASENGSERRGSRVEGRVETSVRCPWCEHGMSTGCCAGWSCIVYLHERHH